MCCMHDASKFSGHISNLNYIHFYYNKKVCLARNLTLDKMESKQKPKVVAKLLILKN